MRKELAMRGRQNVKKIRKKEGRKKLKKEKGKMCG